MSVFLRQSTASQEVILGPFVDSTDGNTEETALTIANTDIKLFKHGATTLANKNSGGATHISNGEYYAVLDATDTDTIGNLEIRVHVSGALAVRLYCVVLDEAVYDVLFGTTALSTLAGTAQTGDAFARLGAPAGASVSADVAAVKVDTAAILVDTGTTLDGRIPAALVGGRMDANVGSLGGTVQSATDLKDFADTGYDPVTHYIAGIDGTKNQLDDLNDITVAGIWDALVAGITTANSIGKRIIDYLTGDIFARVGAPAGASVSADVAAVKAETATILADTNDIQTRIPAALTADGNIKADTLRVNGTAQTAGDIAALINALQLYTTHVVARCTVGAASSTTSVVSSACSPSGAAADQFKGRIIIFDHDTTTASLRGQATDITASSNAATPTFTVTALTTAPASGDTFTIV